MADGTSLTCPLGDGWSLEAAGSRRERGELTADVLLQNGTPIPAYADTVALASDAARQAFVAKATGPGRPSAEAIAEGLLALMTEALTEVQKPTTPVAAVTERLTDYGNAERLVDQHGKDLRYCPDHARWFAWDGTRWARDDAGAEAMRRAKATIRALYDEANTLTDDDKRKALTAHALRSEANTRLAAMVTLAQSEKPVEVRAKQLDVDPWLLNCNNGTLDLRTGTLRDPNPADLITKLVPITYDPAAVCPTFVAFLTKILPDAEVRGFLQRFAGYSQTGDTSEDALVIACGGGQNGKSTLLEILRDALGDYAMPIDADSLMVKRNEGIRSDLARLVGARLITAVESEDGKRLAEGLIKAMTGGDPITARFLWGREFDYLPSFKIWFATNHRPAIRGTDVAIWRRVRLVPFTVTITEEEKDTQLPDRLRSELPGILNWCLAGCLAWQRDGLGTATAVNAATKDYRDEQDVVGAFIADRCVIHADITAKAGPLFAAYQEWCDANGERWVSNTAFGRALNERGFGVKEVSGRRIRQGIGLRHDGPGDDDPPPDEATRGGLSPSGEGLPPFSSKTPHESNSGLYLKKGVNPPRPAQTLPADTPSLACIRCGAPAPYTTHDGRRVCLDCITRPLPPA